MSRYMTDEEKQLVLDLFQQGKDTVEIADIVGRNNTSIGRFLKKSGLQARNNRKALSDEQVLSAYELYNEGISGDQVAEMYNVDGNTIRTAFKEAGLDVRPRGYKSALGNHGFFSAIDTEEKAYYLGLIITDGAIIEQENRSPQLSIMLKQDDKHILDAFAQAVELPAERVKITNRNEVYVRLNSKELCEDLSKYGVVPHKTHLAYIPEVPEDMLPHLLRGILDGDGSVYVSNGLKVSIYGTHKLCEQYKQILIQYAGLKAKGNVFDKEGVSFINFAAKSDVQKIYGYLYEDANVYLHRKKEVFEKNLHLLQ